MMTVFFSAILFILGAIIGSFLNVVILRFGTGMSIARGRSKCFSCGHMLAWYDLVPFFSYLFGRIIRHLLNVQILTYYTFTSISLRNT